MSKEMISGANRADASDVEAIDASARVAEPEFEYYRDVRDEWVLRMNGKEIARSLDGWVGEPGGRFSYQNSAVLTFVRAAYEAATRANHVQPETSDAGEPDTATINQEDQ